MLKIDVSKQSYCSRLLLLPVLAALMLCGCSEYRRASPAAEPNGQSSVRDSAADAETAAAAAAAEPQARN